MVNNKRPKDSRSPQAAGGANDSANAPLETMLRSLALYAQLQPSIGCPRLLAACKVSKAARSACNSLGESKEFGGVLKSTCHGENRKTVEAHATKVSRDANTRSLLTDILETEVVDMTLLSSLNDIPLETFVTDDGDFVGSQYERETLRKAKVSARDALQTIGQMKRIDLAPRSHDLTKTKMNLQHVQGVASMMKESFRHIQQHASNIATKLAALKALCKRVLVSEVPSKSDEKPNSLYSEIFGDDSESE